MIDRTLTSPDVFFYQGHLLCIRLFWEVRHAKSESCHVDNKQSLVSRLRRSLELVCSGLFGATRGPNRLRTLDLARLSHQYLAPRRRPGYTLDHDRQAQRETTPSPTSPFWPTTTTAQLPPWSVPGRYNGI